MRVLHIIPDTVVNPTQQYLGSTKAVRANTQYFIDRKIAYDELVADKRSDRFLLDKLQKTNLNQYTVLFFEYPIYPKSLKYIRMRYPKVKLVVRSHNAEFYHQLDYAKGYLKLKNPLRALLYVLISLRRLQKDFLCSKHADFVLTITEWEKENYWRYITPRTNLKSVPYFEPEADLSVNKVAEKKKQCVCLMSSLLNPLLLDLANTFNLAVTSLGQDYPEWKFYLTGDPRVEFSKFTERIIKTGLLDNPNQILEEPVAMALFSDLGYGFKTKILDAIKNKIFVLVTFNLYKRLPVEVQPYCIIVNPKSAASFKNALDRCLQPYPQGNPNATLKNHAFSVLDTIF